MEDKSCLEESPNSAQGDLNEVAARLKASRAGKMAHLTRRINIVNSLMIDAEYLEEVKGNMKKFNEMFVEFKSLQESYVQVLSEEDKVEDLKTWYEPRMKQVDLFVSTVEKWMSTIQEPDSQTSTQVPSALKVTDQLNNDDGTSVVSSVCSSRSGRSSRSSASSSASARICAEAERAALLAKANALQHKHALEKKEEELRKMKEVWEVQAEIAANTAKIEYLKNAETSVTNGNAVEDDAMNVYCKEMLDKTSVQDVRPKETLHELSKAPTQTARHSYPQNSNVIQQPTTSNTDSNSSAQISYTAQARPLESRASSNVIQGPDLSRILQKQNNLTDMLVKQQLLSTLPRGEIPTFSGEILQYRSFLHSFEHIIESKTDDNEDRLHFLIQYTRGLPQELVRSCQHMSPNQGYQKAKQLLKEHFGNAYKISCAYIEKALFWPSIKPEDPKALQAFALFLRSCCNSMEDLEFMEELDTVSNMRSIAFKLPYKLRERWRTKAFELQEQRRNKVKMVDLVCFIEKQANIVSDPIFGDIQDSSPSKGKPKILKPKSKGSFATYVHVNSPQTTSKDSQPMSCLYCNNGHNLMSCLQFGKQPHREKINFIRQNGICFGCLTKGGHLSKDCTQRLNCSICNKQHPSVLHIKALESTDQLKKTPVSSTQVSLQDGKNTGVRNMQTYTECLLSIVPVQVKSSKGSMILHTYAFLDPGSSACFCTEDLMRKLNITGRKTNILLRTMSQDKSVPSYIVSGLEVSSLEERNFIHLPEVYTQKIMPVDTCNIPTKEELSKWPYLSQVQFPRIPAKVELLIGSNAPKAIEPWEILNSQGDGPYAVKTLLGWVINGPLQAKNTANRNGGEGVVVNRISALNMEEMLMQQYNHDFNERSSEEKAEMSVEDKRFIKIAKQSIKLKNGHYTLDLPFRKDDTVLPNNYQVAEQRLQSLKRKFKRNEKFKTDYTEFLTEVINKGYAEVVPQQELERSDGKLWYIPHHGVYHPKKQTIRVVFDCAATFQGKSLNSELLQGPDLTSTLFDVLTRFRQESVAVMTDIKAMFHQVRVSRSDVDFLRFLWWPSGDVSMPAVEHRMMVHLFGAVSSPSCANFALRQTAKDNKDCFRTEVTNTVENNFYVDDCLKSLPTEHEAVELVKDLTSLCQAGGFHLTKWVSNSRTVLAHIPKEDRAQNARELDLDREKLPTERALGLLWCVDNDVFKFNITVKCKSHTRRNLLSVVSSIYDPLGFLSPFTLPAKLLIQDLCRSKCGWDEEIPQAAADKWTKWIKDLDEIEEFRVARCVKPTGFGMLKQAELHHFSDASEQGYGIVSYLRLTDDMHTVHVSFMLGKARVAPLKHVTIPRLELTAAVLAVRVDIMIRKALELDLKSSTFWTDSQSVLKYVANENVRFRTFVANRISVIRENTDVKQWKFIRTKQNPADLASRGMSASTLVKCREWIHGPDFLWKKEEEWPKESLGPVSLSLDDLEVKRNTTVYSTVIKEKESPTNQLLNYFSSWTKLKLAVAWFLKFKNILCLLTTKRKEILATCVNKDSQSQRYKVCNEMKAFKASLCGQSISLDDLLKAEKAIVEFSQKQRYSEEMSRIEKTSLAGKRLNKFSSLYKLDPVMDDGVLRVGGRLDKSAMPEETKRPIILPKDLHISTLILQHIHEQLGHAGRNHVLSHLRKKYWIINANSAARKVLSKCVVCKRVRGKIGEQKMADLPKERLQADLPPFSNVGVDYFGPFMTKRGRGQVKRYGVIFTCMTSRAVHLEMAHSLTTDSCIDALRRFIARRGQVLHIRSDNGTNLVGAKRELQNSLSEWNQSRIHKAMLQKGIRWTFNPPTASHHGGVWERLIRMVRQILCSVLRQNTLDDEGLQTLFCEIEAILNCRPITTLSDDHQDLEPLTPNHILLLKSNPTLPPGLFQTSDLYNRRRWRQVQYLADLFWKRWSQEYLPLLQERQRWFTAKRGLQKGDVVLVVDSSAPRGSWPIGRITEVLPDSKGLIRTVKLKTKTGFMERPITKLCLLLEDAEH